MMILIPSPDLKSDALKLEDILYNMTKAEILKIVDRMDEYVSPNSNKATLAIRTAELMKEEPIAVLDCISKTELPLVKELIEAAPDQYITRRVRKMPYMVQKMGLVVTCHDRLTDNWNMLMPADARQALAPYIDNAIEEREFIGKADIRDVRKQARFYAAFESFLNGK